MDKANMVEKSRSSSLNKPTTTTTPYKSILLLGAIFLISLSLLYIVYLSFPKLQE